MLITLFAPSNVHLLEIAGVRDALFEANCKMQSAPAYRVRLVTEQGTPTNSASGVTFVPDGGVLEAGQPSDTLIVLGPYGVPAHPSENVARWLREQASRSRRYGSTCTGAFLLAHAGLLSGRRVTTHWQYATRLATDYPDIQVEPDRIFVRDGPVAEAWGSNCTSQRPVFCGFFNTARLTPICFSSKCVSDAPPHETADHVIGRGIGIRLAVDQCGRPLIEDVVDSQHEVHALQAP
jgi:putative intracellular protease/amidase